MKPHRLALALAATAALTGCGDPYAGNLNATPAPATQTPAPSPADQAARDYAQLARTWTPATLAEQYRRQLQATTGNLHGTLKQTGAPAAADIKAAAAARQSATATVLRSDTQLAGDTATSTVSLRELTTSADSVTTSTRTYTAQLRRTAGRWLVTAFEATP